VVHDFAPACVVQTCAGVLQFHIDDIEEQRHVGENHAVDPRMRVERGDRGRTDIAGKDLGVQVLGGFLALADQYRVLVAYELQHG